MMSVQSTQHGPDTDVLEAIKVIDIGPHISEPLDL